MVEAIRSLVPLSALVVAVGCGGARPNFAEGSYQPQPEAYAGVELPTVEAVLHGLTPRLAMFDAEQEMVLFGAPTLAPDGLDAITINLREDATPFRSACSYWFRVPVDPSTWETGETDGAFGGFSVRLGAGEFTVEEGCGSPFSPSIPLVLTFKEPEQGKTFMNLMAALSGA